MPYNTGIKTIRTNTSNTTNNRNSQKVFGRVIDVILDSTHPKYKTYGESLSINGVFYRNIELGEIEDKENTELSFAYQGNTSFSTVPVVGEIVEIKTLPAEDRETFVSSKKSYWISIVPLWNNPHFNAYPDEIQNLQEDGTLKVTPDPDFIEKGNISPLQHFPGDVLIEGRHGQGLRFGGTKFKSSPWSDNTNNGDPIITLSNGVKESSTDFEPTVEDINTTANSIYLTSNHTVKLEQGNYKSDSWLEKPIEASSYKGNQVIINGDRLFFNSKAESIFLSSKKDIGLNATTTNIDSNEYISLDAKEILLGVLAQKKEEPVIKGNQLEIFLRQLISEITSMAKSMTKAKTLDGKPILDLNFQGKISQVVLDSLNKQINPYGKSILKSKKVFTE